MTSSADSLLESVFSLYLKKETRCVVGVIFIFICIHVCFLFVFCCVARLAYQSKNHMCCISNPSSIEMYVKYWLYEENVYWVWCEDIFLIVKQCKKTKKIKKSTMLVKFIYFVHYYFMTGYCGWYTCSQNHLFMYLWKIRKSV